MKEWKMNKKFFRGTSKVILTLRPFLDLIIRVSPSVNEVKIPDRAPAKYGPEPRHHVVGIFNINNKCKKMRQKRTISGKWYHNWW